MKQQAQQEAAARPQLPTEIDVRLYRPTAKGPVLADASVTLNGCFAIRGIQIRAGQNGPFVSMPSRQVHGEYRDICFPCTSGTAGKGSAARAVGSSAAAMSRPAAHLKMVRFTVVFLLFTSTCRPWSCPASGRAGPSD